MKTVFDVMVRDEFIGRINKLNDNSLPQWGHMRVYQMVKHCVLWEQMALGKSKLKRSFIGRLFGKIALKDFIRDSKPVKRNLPTLPELKIEKNKNGDLSGKKKEWIGLINEYAYFSNDSFVHPFFGKMTKEQVGYLAYKHIDHHLRQFGC